MKAPQTRPLYGVLGLTPDATEDDIRKAYRRKALVAHPDKTNDTADKFLDIHTAYKVLSDPKMKGIYDELGEAGLDLKARGMYTEDGQVMDMMPFLKGPAFGVCGFAALAVAAAGICMLYTIIKSLF